MIKKTIAMFLMFFGFSLALEKNITTSEYLDEAQKALKIAYENGAHIKAQYEYGKALGFYNIAKEQASNFQTEKAIDAATKSIEWSLKAMEKINKEVSQ
ncbi:hypothetical protein [Sulfurihydrogenibium sp.]|uniref:hypothetical protein n=1 Tax=Sulfurihydrogenibium sp. TaxID=2053621 RepID=UPI0026354B98|nr:hypothetical protein [Sulfurihydrogenibium sp.]